MSEDGVVCFFRAIQEGMLSVSITGKSSTCVIGDWRLRKDESDNWLSTHVEQVACSESLSVCQVAKYLCTTSDVAYALVRHGLLDSTIEIRNGIASRRVNLHSIEEFRKSYVLGKELAKTLHLASKKIVAHMIELGFLPIAGPSPTLLRCRQFVWSRHAYIEKMERNH